MPPEKNKRSSYDAAAMAKRATDSVGSVPFVRLSIMPLAVLNTSITSDATPSLENTISQLTDPKLQ